MRSRLSWLNFEQLARGVEILNPPANFFLHGFANPGGGGFPLAVFGEG